MWSLPDPAPSSDSPRSSEARVSEILLPESHSPETIHRQLRQSYGRQSAVRQDRTIFTFLSLRLNTTCTVGLASPRRTQRSSTQS
jgi:hypothetical protein